MGKSSVKEAKHELWELKDLNRDAKALENEIDRLYTLVTKVTTSYDKLNVQSTKQNKLEETLMKVDKYKARMQNKINELLEKKQRCMNVVEKIRPRSLQTVLIYYFFDDNTLEQTAEKMNKSYRWTYDIYTSALEKYAENM